MTALLEQLRVVAASLRDFDHAPDHIEVDPVAVSALLAESERAMETLRRERNAAMNERDEAYAALREIAWKCDARECDEIATQREPVAGGARACDAHIGEYTSLPMELMHAASLRAASKAGV